MSTRGCQDLLPGFWTVFSLHFPRNVDVQEEKPTSKKRKILKTYWKLLCSISSSSFSTSSSNTCTSDFSCGMGSKCIKKPGRSSGICMTEVNRYGTKTYSSPSSLSVGVRSYTSEACKFNTDCPIGFKCDREYKVCVKWKLASLNLGGERNSD